MIPQTTTTETEAPEQTPLPELYVRQVDDHSLPAQQVLTDQQESREAAEAPVLFIP